MWVLLQPMSLAYLFEPIATIALAGGPINTIPDAASCSANFAFSLRKPYLVRVEVSQ